MTDQDILARCRGGDTDAFAEIVRKYQPEVLAIAWSVLGGREEARDAAQEIFVQCFQNIDKYDPARDFKNWLCAIAYKRSLDRRRKLGTFRRYLERMSPESAAEADPGAVPGVIMRESINPYLQRLGGRERSVLLLKVHEGHSFREIAEILGGSEGAARVHFFNAKRKMKKWMERTSHVPVG